MARVIRGIPYDINIEIVELDNMGAFGLAIQSCLERITGSRTVPSVFIGSRFIGGGDTVQAMAQDRSLLREILKAHAI